MKALLELEETQNGNMHIVIPKIREVFKGLGNVVIKFDNGDTRSIETPNPNKTIKEICDAINNFYMSK